jgi:AcrR family transcriptional regulator
VDLQTSGRRRRGEDLERAILTAAWDQLVERGYGNFTIDAVADAAGTSRSVLYRRWPDRDALIAAT